MKVVINSCYSEFYLSKKKEFEHLNLKWNSYRYIDNKTFDII